MDGAELALQSLTYRTPAVLRQFIGHDLYDSYGVTLGFPAVAPKTFTRSADEACRASKLFRELLQESLEPFLRNRLALPQSSSAKGSVQIRRADDAQAAVSLQFSRRVSVHSTGAPKGFVWTFIIASWASGATGDLKPRGQTNDASDASIA